MKKVMFVSVLALALTACNPATLQEVNRNLDQINRTLENPVAVATENYTPQNPTWVYKQFILSDAERAQACRIGYQSANAGANQNIAGSVRLTSANGGEMTFYNAFNTLARRCQSIALSGDTIPNSVPNLGSQLALKSGYNATFVFYDAAGRELTRFTQKSTYDGLGNFNNTIIGINGIWLREFTLAQKAAMAQAQSFAILTNFGSGIETFRINPNQLR